MDEEFAKEILLGRIQRLWDYGGTKTSMTFAKVTIKSLGEQMFCK